MRGKTILIAGFLVLAMSTIAARVDAQPELRLTLARYDPYPAQPGNYLDVYLKAENVGGADAPAVSVQLLPAYPFSLDPGTDATSHVGSLGPLESVVLHYKVRVDQNALSGPNELKVQYQTTGAGDTWIGTSFDVYVLGTNKIMVSGVSPTTLEPGRPTDVTFFLSNVGSSPIRNLLFNWKQPDDVILPVGSDNTRYVNSIGTGQNGSVTFTMVTNLDAVPGVYPVGLTLSYTDGNTTTTVASEMGIIVGGTTDFGVSAQGSGGQLSLSIANIGSNNANSVSVEIPSQPVFSTVGESSAILGNLNAGDYTTASFQLASNAARNATGTTAGNGQGLTVRISYTDTTGQRRSVDKVVALTGGIFSQGSASGSTATRTQGSGTGLTYIIIGVVGIAVIVGFFLYRQRKGRKR
jgi:hypothetical protein